MRNHERPESLVILSSASDLLLRATDGMLVDGEACTLPQLEVTRHYLYLCSYSSVTHRVWVVTMFNYKTCIPPTSLSCYNNCLCSAPRKFLLVWLMIYNIVRASLINFHCLVDIESKRVNCQLLEATARAVQPVLELGESGLAVADGLSNLLKVNGIPCWMEELLWTWALEIPNAWLSSNLILLINNITKWWNNKRNCIAFISYVHENLYRWWLLGLLQCRLSATIRCLSHPSAHVRALSTSVLRDILHTGSIKSNTKPAEINGNRGPSYQYLSLDVIDWQADVEKCLEWEAHSRLATGMPIQFLDTAAKELGCIISIWRLSSFWQPFSDLRVIFLLF